MPQQLRKQQKYRHMCALAVVQTTIKAGTAVFQASTAALHAGTAAQTAPMCASDIVASSTRPDRSTAKTWVR